MGQQQLLLIILGVIIVGIAVAVGISMFSASASSANRDAVASDLSNLASMAQQFYRRPSSMGGGNNSFDGTGASPATAAWVIPGQLDTTANGVYVAPGATLSAQSVTIIGVGTEEGTSPTFDNAHFNQSAVNVGRVQITHTVSPSGQPTVVVDN